MLIDKIMDKFRMWILEFRECGVLLLCKKFLVKNEGKNLADLHEISNAVRKREHDV